MPVPPPPSPAPEVRKRPGACPSIAPVTVVQVLAGYMGYRTEGESAAAMDVLCSPRTRIVSLTCTEKGYMLRTDGTLDTDCPAIRRDAAAFPQTPNTVIAVIAAVCHRRRAAGLRPVTVVSCDNLPANGKVTQSAVVQVCARAVRGTGMSKCPG